MNLFSFSPFLILLPYFVLEPLTKILEWLNIPMIKDKKGRIMGSRSKGLYWIGKIITVLIVLGCILSMFIVSANLE